MPVLGLTRASIGEIVLTTRATFTEYPTTDVCCFWLAIAAGEKGDYEQAATHWMSCLEAGDMKAHFGLGYTLLDLGRHHEAYGHLRRYTELAPHNSWAWAWRGRVCEELGELDEARLAYRRAVRLERQGSFETYAGARLEKLRDRRAR